MLYIISILVVCAVIAFVAGILVGRKNAKTVNTIVDDAKAVSNGVTNIANQIKKN